MSLDYYTGKRAEVVTLSLRASQYAFHLQPFKEYQSVIRARYANTMIMHKSISLCRVIRIGGRKRSEAERKYQAAQRECPQP